jgi:hypothetical protein
MGTLKRSGIIVCGLAAGFLAIAAALAGPAASPPAEPRPAGAGPAAQADKEPLEIVETRGGKNYRGRVVGYDAGTKSYILLVDQIRLSVSESEILTIRSGEVEPAKADPAAAPEGAQDRPAGRAGDRPPPPRKEKEDAALGDPPAPASPPPALPRATAEPAGREGGAVTLEALVRDCRSWPTPRTPEAAQALSMALDRLRAHEPLAAVDPLKRAMQVESDCPTPAILLAAIRLEAESNPEEAWPLLLLAGGKSSGLAAWKSLAARAAFELGYRKLGAKLQAEAIEARTEGAEREYRLARFWRDRDPDRSRKAWLEYRRLDPDWEKVSTAEGPRLKLAVQALERGAASEAASILAHLCEGSPWMEEEARPLLLRALTARAERSQAAGRSEVAIGDLRAVEEEFPDRRAEVEPRRREIEDGWVKARLKGAAGARELAAAVKGFSLLIPDVKERFGPSIAAAFVEAARSDLGREGFDAAAETLKSGSEFGAVPDGALVDTLAEVVRKDASAGDLTRARARLKLLTDLGVKGEAIDRAKREVERGGEAPRPSPEAAGKPEELADPATIPHFPLVAGSQWRYLYGDGSREVLKLAEIEARKDGRSAYRFTSELILGDARIPYQKTGYFSGPCFHLGSSSRALGADPVLKAPVACGTRWSWRKGDIACEREYVAVDARITCRAGSFDNCLKVKATSRLDSGGTKSRPIVQYFYYASGVGLVKIEGETPFDGRELEEYRIGDGPPLKPPALEARSTFDPRPARESTVESRGLTAAPGRSTDESALPARVPEKDLEARKRDSEVREPDRSRETPSRETTSSHVETPAARETGRGGIEGGLGGSPEAHSHEDRPEKPEK